MYFSGNICLADSPGSPLPHLKQLPKNTSDSFGLEDTEEEKASLRLLSIAGVVLFDLRIRSRGFNDAQVENFEHRKDPST